MYSLLSRQKRRPLRNSVSCCYSRCPAEHGTFWPQNAEYSNTSELVKMIGKAHGNRIILLKGFTIPLKIAGLATGLVDKAFGNLAYDQKMSRYKEEYRLYSLKNSIEETEA